MVSCPSLHLSFFPHLKLGQEFTTVSQLHSQGDQQEKLDKAKNIDGDFRESLNLNFHPFSGARVGVNRVENNRKI
jgi:lysyl-tRNA synthetase class II